MVNLKRYEFKCPFCGQERVTFITEEKLNEVMCSEKLMQEIFNPEYFESTYREIFISNICSKCQGNTFGSPKNEKDYFDVDIDADTTELENKIAEMYQNAK